MQHILSQIGPKGFQRDYVGMVINMEWFHAKLPLLWECLKEQWTQNLKSSLRAPFQKDRDRGFPL